MRVRLCAPVFAVVISLATIGQAHVRFLTAQDSVFVPGAQATLTWYDSIPHDTQGYHVEIFWDVAAEPERIVSDLPPGTTSYQWQVPERECDSCRLHVIQDNSGADYGAFLNLRITSSAGSAGAGGSAEDDSAVATSGVTPSGAGGATSASASAVTSRAESVGGSGTPGPTQPSSTGMGPSSGAASAGSSCAFSTAARHPFAGWSLPVLLVLAVRRWNTVAARAASGVGVELLPR